VTATPSHTLTLAYLIPDFPVISHTFISREIKELEKRGLKIHCFSIHRPAAHEISAEDDYFRDRVYYLFPMQKWRLLLAHLRTQFQHPFKYLYWLWYVVSRPDTRLSDRLRCFYHFVEAVYLLQEIKKRGIKHLHAHFMQGNATMALVISKLLPDCHYSITVHNSATKIGLLLFQEKIRHAQFVVAISNYNKAMISQALPDCRDKIAVIHCGLDPDSFSPVTPAAPILTLLAIGRLVWEKNYLDLIKACQILRDQGLVFRCQIVGEGRDRPQLEAAITEYGLQAQVQLIGLVLQEKIQDYYNQADIFVLSSVTEGIPVVLMEAMAKGLPVVATRITGIPELVEDQRSGLLVPAQQPAALAAAIAQLADNPTLRTRMGERGREKIITDFHIVKNAETLSQLFKARISAS